MTLIIIIGVVVLLILWFVVTYNKLIGLRNKKDDQWSQIEVQLKKGAKAYYKVRAYKMVNGKKVYSNYSKQVSVRV